MDIQGIQVQVRSGNYQFRLHAIERASLRGIDPVEIKEALLSGEVIEAYHEDQRGESCLVYGKTPEGKDLHMVCGVASALLWIITVYEPNPEEWVDPKTRRVAP